MTYATLFGDKQSFWEPGSMAWRSFASPSFELSLYPAFTIRQHHIISALILDVISYCWTVEAAEDAEADVDAEGDVDAEAGVDAEGDVDAEADADTEADADVVPDVDAVADVDAKTEVDEEAELPGVLKNFSFNLLFSNINLTLAICLVPLSWPLVPFRASIPLLNSS